MKTRFKTSNRKEKFVEGFSIKGGEVFNMEEYYRLKYPQLFSIKNKNIINNFKKNLNFRNSQNYVVGELMKEKLEKKESLNCPLKSRV